MEFKESIKKCMKKIGNTNGSSYAWQDLQEKKAIISSLNACIMEASESSRMRMEETLPKYHEDHIAGKGQITTALQCVTQIYSSASSNEDTRSKSSSG